MVNATPWGIIPTKGTAMFNLSLLTGFEVNAVIGVVSLLVGIFGSTKITDIFKGIPSDLRTALTSVETTAVANLKAAIPVKAASPAAAAAVANAAASIAAAAPAPAPAPVA